jgi:hypothetical protein
MPKEKRRKETYLRVWYRPSKASRIPIQFENELRLIAKYADNHPSPDRYLRAVVNVARELASVDGVDVAGV